MGNCGVLTILLFILPVSVFAYTETSSFYYEDRALYDNFEVSDDFEISIDKFEYKPGEFLKIKGNVFVSVKQFVHIQFLTPSGEIGYEFQTRPAQSGTFEVVQQIPEEISNGRYTLIAKYGGSGVPISFDFVVKGTDDPITIPEGSFSKYSGLSFQPITFTTSFDSPIKFKNDDNTIHRILEGTPQIFQAIQETDHKPLFDSGYLKPGESFEIFLAEGDYEYFCTIHPWTLGYITVLPLDNKNEQSVADSSTPLIDGNNDFLAIQMELESYNPADIIIGHGLIKKFETASNVIIQINDPNNNLVAVGQILPIQDKTCCYELDDKKKKIVTENIASWFEIWKKNTQVLLSVSDSFQQIEGKNNLDVKIDITKGSAALYHDYGISSLQDWSEYDYLSFWYKGNGIAGTDVLLRDNSWGTGGKFEIMEDSLGWRQVMIPLKSTYTNMDLAQVRGLEFLFDFDTAEINGQLSIDNIELLMMIPEQTGSFTFILDDLNFVPESDGLHKISAIYGEKKYHAGTSFMMEISNLVEKDYKGFDIYQSGAKYHGIPAGQDFDINQLKNLDYVNSITANSLNDLKNILTPFPISNSELLKIWNEKDELKAQFPEVALGNFDNLKDWASSTGWKEESRLSKLISIAKMDGLNDKIDLPKDNIASWFEIWKKNTQVLLSVSDSFQQIEGKNNLDVKIDITKGSAALYHDYGISSLQDWSEYDYLSFWYKGNGIAGTDVLLRDNSWGTGGKFEIMEDSLGWRQVMIPLKSTYTNMDLAQVRGLEFLFNSDTAEINGQLSIDNIELLKDEPSKFSSILSDKTLLDIWNEKNILQSGFPEVKDGNLKNLKAWALYIGWNQEPRLSQLMLEEQMENEGSSSNYLQTVNLEQQPENSELSEDQILIISQIITGIVATAIAVPIGYKIYREKKSVLDSTP